MKISIKTKEKLNSEAEKFIKIIQSTAWKSTKPITHIIKEINCPVAIR